MSSAKKHYSMEKMKSAAVASLRFLFLLVHFLELVEKRCMNENCFFFSYRLPLIN